MTEGSMTPIFSLGRFINITKIKERHFVKNENNGEWEDHTLQPDTSLIVRLGNLRCEFTYYRYPKTLTEDDSPLPPNVTKDERVNPSFSKFGK